MPDTNRSAHPLDKLYDIVGDLWGTMQSADAESAPTAAAPQAEVRGYQQSFPPFDLFWRTADETVDWTEALAYAAPQDSAVSPARWAFLHSQAERVLEGDVAAYVTVLQQSDPLGDLKPYAAGFDVQVESADRITAAFQGLPQYLNAPEEERRRYLCGISLRCARDLMALLPVCEAAITARQNDKVLLQVTFTRQELQKVRFSVVDPVAFAEQCGGVFA